MVIIVCYLSTKTEPVAYDLISVNSHVQILIDNDDSTHYMKVFCNKEVLYVHPFVSGRLQIRSHIKSTCMISHNF